MIRELIQSTPEIHIKAILDDKYTELNVDNGVYKGPISAAPSLLSQHGNMKFVIAIGNNEIRKDVVAKLAVPIEGYLTLIHKTAVVSPSACIGQGTVVMANTVINADAAIGSHVIVNTGAIVEHDSMIADYVHLAPHATITGSVRVKEGTMIGAGATVIPGICIGEWTVVGAGATVIHDIPSYCTVVGTPAKTIMKSKDHTERLNVHAQ